jgi:hypothetical protein
VAAAATAENSYQLRHAGILPRVLSSVIGARNVNMVLRKREEIRLSLWIEQQMRERFGSRRRAMVVPSCDAAIKLWH